MKKFLSSILLSISLFGATNQLVVPTDGSSIVDIGYNKPQGTYAVTVPKDWVEYNALTKTVDNSIYSMERVLSPKYDCETDYLGIENCTEQSVDCTGSIQTDKGISTLNTGKKISYRTGEILNNVVAGSYNAPATAGVDVSYEGNFAPGVIYFSTWTEDLGYYIVITSLANGSVVWQSANTLGSQDSNTNIDYYNNSVTVGENVHVFLQVQEGGGAGSTNIGYSIQGNSITGNYVCSPGFIPSDSINSPSGKCELNYTYYTYSCNSDLNNYGLSWTGPVINSGGDCNGNCGGNGCTCNNSTPPSNNCVRSMYTCPFDATKLCTITTNDKSSVNNVLDGYIYDKGSASTYSNSVTIDKTCPEGLLWNKTNGTCETDVSFTCLNSKFSYDKATGQCTGPVECEGTLLEDGSCQIEATADCQDGYKYDKMSSRCETVPYCDRGTYNTITNMCEDDIKCPTGFTYNSTSKRCEAPYVQKAMKCPQTTDMFINSYPSYCITNPILTQPIYTGKFQRMWWFCNTCWGNDWGKLLGMLQEATVVTGGTNINLINSSTRTMKPNNTKPFYINLNGGTKLAINGGDTFNMFYKGFTNSTTNKTISGGGKPMVYIEADLSCGSWRTVPATKDFPAHQVCDDMTSDYASCPSGYIMGTKDGNPICYKPPVCPSGYSLSENGMQCVYTVTCEAGYTADYKTNMCIKNGSPGIAIDLNAGVYYVVASCPNGDILDSINGVCAYDPTCNYNGQLDITDDRCVLQADYSCPTDKTADCADGSYYDTKTSKCISIPSCGTGTWDYLNNICTSSANCPSGYTMNSNTGNCEKAIATEPYSCLSNETMVDTTTKDYCRVSKVNGECPIGYTETLNANYCGRDITCPTAYPNIDYVNNVCYKL